MGTARMRYCESILRITREYSEYENHIQNMSQKGRCKHYGRLSFLCEELSVTGSLSKKTPQKTL
jgi:hypothetical protein